MERLTTGIYTFQGKVEDVENQYLIKVQQKLKEYEDLEEQGLLLKLPCKVGAKAYQLRIDNTKYLMSNKRVWEIVETSFEIRNLESIGKTVFLTQEQAEEALKRMKEQGNVT